MVQRTAVSRWKSLKLFTQVHFVAKHYANLGQSSAHLVPFDTFCLDNSQYYDQYLHNVWFTYLGMFIHIYIYTPNCWFLHLFAALRLSHDSYATYCIHSELLFLDCEVRSTAIMMCQCIQMVAECCGGRAFQESKPKLFLRNLQPCKFDKDNALMGDLLIRCTVTDSRMTQVFMDYNCFFKGTYPEVTNGPENNGLPH